MKYVVIGSSAAGVNAIRELRRLDKEYTPAAFFTSIWQERERSRGCVSSRKILKRSIKSTG